MDVFLKASALTLTAVILCIILSSYGKNFVILVIIAVCCFMLIASVTYLKPIMEFIQKLQSKGDWDPQWLEIILKAVGLGFITEIITNVCNDSGNSALGKTLQYLSTFVILWLSLPLFTTLLEMLDNVLNAL